MSLWFALRGNRESTDSRTGAGLPRAPVPGSEALGSAGRSGRGRHRSPALISASASCRRRPGLGFGSTGGECGWMCCPPSGLKCRMEARGMDRGGCWCCAASDGRVAGLGRADQEGPWSPRAVLIIFSLLWMVSRENPSRISACTECEGDDHYGELGNRDDLYAPLVHSCSGGTVAQLWGRARFAC